VQAVDSAVVEMDHKLSDFGGHFVGSAWCED
jgi:hypothetical protein